MTATTYPDFNHDTEAVEVAKQFNQNVRGKSILITGVNQKGIGFATAEAFVSAQYAPHKHVTNESGRHLNLRHVSSSLVALHPKSMKALVP